MRISSVCMISRVCASSEENGSSISKISGSMGSARARLTRWRMPPDSWRGWEFSKPSSPTSFNSSMVRCRSAGPTWPATSRPMIALANTVRQGNRLSFWNTKPRSPPGRCTARPSSKTSPELAGSRPATIRRKVVLPQPEGPTTEMNSPRSTSRLMSCSACRSLKAFPRCEIFSFGAMWASLVLGPRHQPVLNPSETGCEHDPGGREHDDAGEQLGHVEGIRRLRDQPSEPGARAEQFRDHDADEAASDAELEPGEDERHG